MTITTAPTAAPEWRTLKGVTTPFRVYGQEHDNGFFRTAGDRRRPTGEPLTITRMWVHGGVRRAEDATGREVYLGGTATKFWTLPGGSATVATAAVTPATAAPADATPADVTRTDGVAVLPEDGRGRDTWTVELGDDFLGVIRDEGADMARGRYCTWASHDNTPRFFHSGVDAVDAVVEAWPTTAALLAEATGATVAAVLAEAATVDAVYRAAGRRAVLRIASCTGADTRITKAAAAEIAERLTSPAPDTATGTEERTPARHAGPPTPPATGAPAAPPAPAAAPEWRTLKGLTPPFRVHGREDEGRFRAAMDRKRVTGEPLTLTRLWYENGGYYAEDVNGRQVTLYGAAAKYWITPCAT